MLVTNHKHQVFGTIFILWMLLISGLSNSQPIRVWSNVIYNSHFSTKPEWLYGGLIEARYVGQPGLLYQALVQGQIGYSKFNTTQFWIGYTWMPQTITSPTERTNSIMQRLYQEIDTNFLNNIYFVLFSRFRLEERQLLGEQGVGVVYRQLLTLNIPQLIIQNNYTPLIANELILNLNKPIWSNQKKINQNRLIIGLTFPFIKHKCQLAYINQVVLTNTFPQINNILYFSLIL